MPRLTAHGEIVYHPDSGGRVAHPFWGSYLDYWDGPVAQSRPGCGSCGKPPLEAPRQFADATAWFDHAKAKNAAAGGDFHGHMDTLRELASRCEHVTEVSGWNKPTLAALCAGCPGKVVGYCHGVKEDWSIAASVLGSRFQAVVRENPDSIDPTDLLVVDTLHRASRVFDELTKLSRFVRKYLVVHCTAEPYGESGDDGSPGVMPGVRGFISQNRSWTVVRNDRHNHGLIVLSNLDEDRLQPPSTARKILNFGRALVRHGVDMGRPTSDKAYELRLAECLICPHRAIDACGLCGCPLTKKLSWASESCPDEPKRWDIEKDDEATPPK